MKIDFDFSKVHSAGKGAAKRGKSVQAQQSGKVWRVGYLAGGPRPTE